ncbi:MAG: hypothetical protein E6J91_03790 [Deltaproteobacteria bacterium]|nr:MAG: hypothetical protein E6J91_03790 [Deltaproteobacteria bacterium]
MLCRLSVLAVSCWASIAVAGPGDAPVVCKAPPASASITLQFRPETSITDLATWITATLCKNVVFDAAVPKSGLGATLLSPKKLTPKQALQLVVDAIEATGLVVVQKPDTIIIKLGPSTPRACSGVASAPQAGPSSGPSGGPPEPTPPEPEPDDDSLALAMASGIRQIDETHYELKHSLVEKVLLNPMAMAKGARVVPSMKNGKPDGVKLYAIRPSSGFARLGLANGDTVVSVNKLRLDSADQALEIYTQLREAKRIDVEVVRRGKSLTLVYTIVP